MDPVIGPARIVIVMPVYRDWESASMVCRLLDEQMRQLPELRVQVLLVDDGSPDGMRGWTSLECSSLVRVEVLQLRINIGHQRAICAGLCHIYENIPCEWVLVMDADGEDRPEDTVRLIRTALSRSTGALFAARRKRLEGPVFQAGYLFYRGIHRMLTGIAVRVGNFSIISRPVLSRLVAMPELWNHYAGALFKSKVDFQCIPIDRGKRFHGKSHMNLISLVTHGLSAVATFQEVVATRILIFNVIGLILLTIALGVVFALRLWTDLAIPGWATYATGLIVIALLQLVALSFNLVFTLMSNRSRVTFVPVRDYAVYVAKVESVAAAEQYSSGVR